MLIDHYKYLFEVVLIGNARATKNYVRYDDFFNIYHQWDTQDDSSGFNN
jgi:hypothetical protein